MIRKTGTTWLNAEPLSFKTNISPSLLTQIAPPDLKISPSTTKAEVKITLKQTSFLWDKQTALTAFEKAGLLISDIYYLDGMNNRQEDLDLEKEKNIVFNLIVVASKAKK